MIVANVEGLSNKEVSHGEKYAYNDGILTSRFGQLSSILETRERVGVLVAP